MKNAERLLILLAASGLGDKSILDGLKSIRALTDRELLARVRDIRHALRNVRTVAKEGPYEDSDSKLEHHQRLMIADQVAHLLQREGGLSTLEAVNRLTKSLMRDVSVAVPEFNSKEGLRGWLTRLNVHPSVLLHLATRIRNEVMHSPQRDWPLRDRS